MRALAFLVLAAFLSAATPAFAAGPLGAINMVVAGTPDPNGVVPAYDKVPGAGVDNLDIPIPQATIAHGGQYLFWVSFEDFSYTGSCSMSYEVSQKVGTKKTVLLKQNIITFNCQPGLWGAGLVSKPVPNSPGVATLTGIATIGTAKYKLNTVLNIQ